VIDEQGKVKRTVTEVELKDLPKVAVDAINQYYDQHYTNFYKHTDESGTITYESDFVNGDFTSGVIFDKDGNGIGKVARDAVSTVKIYNQ
jgi:hypothetical protein